MEKKNILLVSNSPHLSYGYSIVFKEVAKKLGEDFDLYYLGMQTCGAPKKYENYTLLGNGYDSWCQDILEDYIIALDIDVLITTFDMWMNNMSYIQVVVDKYPKLRWICHVTVNSSPISPFMVHNIKGADVLVAPSKFVHDELNYSKLGHKSVLIPHFVDIEFFKPDQEAGNEMRRRLGLENKFIFLAVMRNRDLHKNPGALLKAYSFIINKNRELYDRSVLLFVTDPKESVGVNLEVLRDMYSLRNHVIFPVLKYKDGKILLAKEGEPGVIPCKSSISVSREDMAMLYNACDVHINSSSGESFGLPTLESMSCGKPQIVNIATTGKELVADSGAGIAVDAVYPEMLSTFSDIQLISIGGLVDAMSKVFSEPETSWGEKARDKALEYEKEKILNKWTELINDIFEGKKDKKINYNDGELGL